MRLPYGQGEVRLLAERRLVSVVRIGRPLVERVVAPTAASLPVHRGDRLGEVRVYASGKLLGTRPLVAGRSVARPDTFGRAAWYAGKAAHDAWSWVT